MTELTQKKFIYSAKNSFIGGRDSIKDGGGKLGIFATYVISKLTTKGVLNERKKSLLE